ncbi:SHOCT domain-containing protein [Amnibacterium setariae]|uniref:SHOCT domain-containing protein n=2 Tax=Amnibacterium setariae TaxID=2306585 RepID=A0A3A1TZF8_9MICO|nr:SHOCT domain-containing protein [Amnibacterium setariae]
MITDRRLLFSGLGFVSQSQEAWPLAVVADVRVGDHGLALRVLGQPERFTGKFADLARVAEALPTATGAAGESIAGELERLVRLRDSGVLTEAEFEGAKRRLLK